MRKSIKFIVVAGTLAALTVPSVAMANPPAAGQSPLKPGDQTVWQTVPAGTNLVGEYSMVHTQNGQVVRVQAQDGQRSADVQSLLVQSGINP